ncbi:MAG: hypothetical protein J5606_03515 [Bacteroidales bacterium]|nr:hypothetical protein [Bacteroidales bacterium]
MKKQQNNDILDDNIEILGKDWNKIHKRNKTILIVCAVIVILAGLFFTIFVLSKNTPEENNIEEEITVIGTEENTVSNISNTNGQSIATVCDTAISIIQESDSQKVFIPIRIYTPYNAQPELIAGSDQIDSNDQSLILVVQAADIRGDNQNILGDFVLKGKTLSNGHSHLGFCAIIDDKIHIGKGSQTAYLDSAIAKQGYFFRQYPLVVNGIQIANKPQHTNIRRALCQWNEKLVVIESAEKITLNNFSQALVNMGVANAINIIGGSEAQGWAVTDSNQTINIANKYRDYQPNRTFIVFKKRL